MIRIFLVILAAQIACNASGDRKLDQTEVEQLLQTLTRHPRKNWLPYGTIQAHHLQYHDFEIRSRIPPR